MTTTALTPRRGRTRTPNGPVVSTGRPAGRRLGGQGAAARAVLLTTLLAACIAPPPPLEPKARMPVPKLSVAALTAPATAAHRELRDLDTLPESPAVRLRRAFLLIENGSTDRALRDLNQLLFGRLTPSPDVQALALYVRALAHERRGDHERAGLDLQEAEQVASDPDLRRRIEARTRPVVVTPTPVASTAVLARSAWSAAAGRQQNMSRMGRAHRITVHHSARITRPGSRANAAAAVRAIQDAHMRGNGWGDIGYHFLIDPDGRIWTGRPLAWQGAHAGDAARNRGNIGICLLGNFVRGREGQDPPPRQLHALRGLLVQLSTDHRIRPSQIHTHRELRATACPGDRLQSVVDRLRQAWGAGDLALALDEE